VRRVDFSADPLGDDANFGTIGPLGQEALAQGFYP
jgi:hypothetical protein